MTTLELKLSLPDRFAEETQAAGLLTPEAIESMLRETLRRQHVEELHQAMATLAAANIPPLVIEVADASLRYDREVEVALYARPAIPEVWLVDAGGKRLTRFRDPAEGAYARIDEPDVAVPLDIAALVGA